MTVSDNFFSILIAAGGAGAVSAAIMGSLWKLSADALLEKFKHSQAEALERLKADLAESAARSSRYEGPQFGAYQEIWDTLSDLRLASDRLWDRATKRNVDEFGRHFLAVRGIVYGSELVIEPADLATLQALVDQFWEFYDGKEGLVDLRRQRPRDDVAIQDLIRRNGQVRERFSATVETLSRSLRERVRGQPASTAGA